MAVSARERKAGKEGRELQISKRNLSDRGVTWISGLETVKDGAMEIIWENIPGSPAQRPTCALERNK